MNHPNRNWRQRMQQAADQWMSSDAALALVEIPITAGQQIDALRYRLRMAYLEITKMITQGPPPGAAAAPPKK